MSGNVPSKSVFVSRILIALLGVCVYLVLSTGYVDFIPSVPPGYGEARLDSGQLSITAQTGRKSRLREHGALKGAFVVEVQTTDGAMADDSIPRGTELIQGREVIWFSRLPIVWAATRKGHFEDTNAEARLPVVVLSREMRIGPLPLEVQQLIREDRAALVLAKDNDTFQVLYFQDYFNH